MGLPITAASNYTGFTAVALNDYNTTQLAAYITKYETFYLLDLLGQELYDLFVADLNGSGVPQSARFLAIYNALTIDDPFYDKNYKPFQKYGSYWFGTTGNAYKQLKSEGIKEMLKNFIWFHWSRDQRFQGQQAGVNIQIQETSREAISNEFAMVIEQRFNNAVASYQAIRVYMQTNLATYPELKGEEKCFIE